MGKWRGKGNLHLLWRVNPPWQDPRKRWQLTCNNVRFDCPIDIILSTRCPNQGLLIDGAVDRNLSKSCQLGHIVSCSDTSCSQCCVPTVFWDLKTGPAMRLGTIWLYIVIPLWLYVVIYMQTTTVWHDYV